MTDMPQQRVQRTDQHHPQAKPAAGDHCNDHHHHGGQQPHHGGKGALILDDAFRRKFCLCSTPLFIGRFHFDLARLNILRKHALQIVGFQAIEHRFQAVVKGVVVRLQPFG